MLVLTIFCFSLLSGAASLKCHTGFIPWHSVADGNSSVKLEECQKEEKCCQRVDSLPGRSFKCSSNCPVADSYPKCDSMMDSSWCYCKNHEDSKCAPFDLDESQVKENGTERNETISKDKEEKVKEIVNLNRRAQSGLQCYVGFSSWRGPLENSTTPEVTLQNCSKEHSCCHTVRSLPGTSYSCSSSCPEDWSKPCSPTDNKLMDVSWCYCKDHKDENCTPYQETKNASSPSISDTKVTAPLKCYTGFVPWDKAEDGNSSVTLEDCRQGEGCCLYVSSLPGKTYKCAADCPQTDSYPQCKKELDSSWCHCKSHEDSKCAPTKISELRAPQIRTKAKIAIEEKNEVRNDNIMQNDNMKSGLQCYVGLESWSGPVENDTTSEVSLQQCSKEHSCCHIVHSMFGSKYSCSAECPEEWSNACGPPPEEGVMDVSWCFCKNHTDKNCIPSPTATATKSPIKAVIVIADKDVLMRAFQALVWIVNMLLPA